MLLAAIIGVWHPVGGLVIIRKQGGFAGGLAQGMYDCFMSFVCFPRLVATLDGTSPSFPSPIPDLLPRLTPRRLLCLPFPSFLYCIIFYTLFPFLFSSQFSSFFITKYPTFFTFVLPIVPLALPQISFSLLFGD